MGGWFRKEIKTVADLKGLKFRIGGFAGKVVQKLGVVPQQLAGGDIYPALEKGTIDAAEWVGPYDDEKLGFNKIAPHYYYPGWWEGGPMLLAYVNLDKWNALPKYYQTVLTQAGHFANNWMMAKYDQANPPALKKLLAGRHQAARLLAGDHAGVFKAAKELYAEISASNANFKKVYESLTDFSNDGYQWWQVAELGFDSLHGAEQIAGLRRRTEARKKPRSESSGVLFCRLRRHAFVIVSAGRNRAAAARSAAPRS